MPGPKRRTQRETNESVSQVIWQTPPEGPVMYDWDAIAKQLRRKPGQWALVFERDRASVVNAIRRGKVRPVDPVLGYQTRTTNNERPGDGPRVCSLYMRYVKPEEN